jgi:hypothetical protein
MKPNFYLKACLSAFIALLLFFQNNVSAQGPSESDIYCQAYAGCTVFINNVKINNQINNSSACSANGYGNYTPQTTNLGVNTDFTVEVNATGTTANTVCKVWIDWNQSAFLTDPGEVYILTAGTVSGQYVKTISVPPDAWEGTTRIRIRIGQNNVNPCGYIAQGETEDYSAVIQTVLYIDSISNNSFCAGDTFSVFCNPGMTFNPGNHFVVQLSDANGAFTNPGIAADIAEVFSGTIPCSIPVNTPQGAAYELRVLTTDPPSVSNSYATQLNVNARPNLQVFSPLNVCSPALADLTSSVTDLNNVPGNVSFWIDPACTVAVANPQAVTNAGYYYIRKTGTLGGCSDIDSVLVVLHEKPIVNAGPDLSVNYGDCNTIIASVAGGSPPFIYSWNPATGLSNPSVLQPQVCPLANAVYSIVVSDQHGCSNSDNVAIQVTFSGIGNLSGIVTYDNDNQAPLHDVSVSAISGGNVVSTVLTNSAGVYTFSNIPAGNYTISCSSGFPWNGGNAVDALLTMKHFANLVSLQGIRLKASDADNSGNTNAVDALLIMKRFVSMISSFSVGDWIFEKPQLLILPGSNNQQNIKGICTGDVNASFNGVY